MSEAPAILVTGGAGYVGAQTCKALSRAGWLPVTLDNLSTGHAAAVKWGPLIEADIRDAGVVKAAIRRHAITGVLHFAACSLVAESVADPAKYFDNNLHAAILLAEAALEAGVRAFVFSSTAAVYGAPAVSPIPEDHPTRPINPYGASKLAFETVLRRLGDERGLRWNALRYFNAAGADPDGEVGESHQPETHLIPLLCRAAERDEPPLTVFGTDYDTPDGACVRDYVHVADLAQAHLLALRRLMGGGDSGVFNVGTGRGASVLEVIAAAQAVLGRPVPHVLGPRREGDPPSLVADGRRLRDAMGWAPQHSDIETIVSTAALWQSRRPY